MKNTIVKCRRCDEKLFETGDIKVLGDGHEYLSSNAQSARKNFNVIVRL